MKHAVRMQCATVLCACIWLFSVNKCHRLQALHCHAVCLRHRKFSRSRTRKTLFSLHIVVIETTLKTVNKKTNEMKTQINSTWSKTFTRQNKLHAIAIRPKIGGILFLQSAYWHDYWFFAMVTFLWHSSALSLSRLFFP